MKKIPISEYEQRKGFFYQVSHEVFDCQGCGRKLMYFTDIEPGEYYGRCENCNHVKHVKIEAKE